MFVGCSEINVNVIVKHKQHVGIIWPFCLPGGTCSVFQCLGLLGGFSTLADTMGMLLGKNPSSGLRFKHEIIASTNTTHATKILWIAL